MNQHQHQRLPRHIRRMIHDGARNNYQREEYANTADRDARWAQARHIAGAVRFSDAGAVGLVYVIAWPRHNDSRGRGTGVGAANRETTRPLVDTHLGGNPGKIGLQSLSMETSSSPRGKNEFPGLETVSIQIS